MSVGLAGVDFAQARNDELAAIAELIEDRHRPMLARIRELRGEQARRQRDERIRYFKPHTKQDAFTRATSLVRVLTGGNRCLSADTRIMLATGKVIEIRNARRGNKVVAVTRAGEMVYCQVVRKWDNGVKPVRRYIFEKRDLRQFSAGACIRVEIVCTPDHKVMPYENADMIPIGLAPCVWVKGHSLVFVECLSEGSQQTYDIEIDHPSHTFMLANGMAVSNSGKTEVGCAEVVAHAMGYRPWLPKSDPNYYVTISDGHGGRKPIQMPNRGLLVGESFGEQVKKVFIRKLLGDIETGQGGLLPKTALHGSRPTKKNPQGVIVSIMLANGSIIDLQSYEQDSDLFESVDYDYACLDEPPPRPHFIAIKRGLTDRHGPMWITMTPLKEAWLYKEVVQRNDVETWAMSIWDNVGYGLTHDGAEELLSYMTDEEREMREHGRFFHLMGLIYKMYGRIHRIPRWSHPRTGSQTIPADWGMWMAIDPHPRTPHHALWAAVRPDSSIFVVGELKNTHRSNLTPDFARDILEYERNFLQYDSENIQRLIDPLATTPNPHGEDESILDDFADNGVVCEVGSKQRDVGIGRTKKLLYHDQDAGVYPMLYFYNDLPIIHEQMGTYQWADHSKTVSRRKDDLQEPIKKNDHMVENLHRIILDNPAYAGFAAPGGHGNLGGSGSEGSYHDSEFSTGY